MATKIITVGGNVVTTTSSGTTYALSVTTNETPLYIIKNSSIPSGWTLSDASGGCGIVDPGSGAFTARLYVNIHSTSLAATTNPTSVTGPYYIGSFSTGSSAVQGITYPSMFSGLDTGYLSLVTATIVDSNGNITTPIVGYSLIDGNGVVRIVVNTAVTSTSNITLCSAMCGIFASVF